MPSNTELQEMLKQEQFIADVLRLRQTEKPKPWWERAGVVPGVTAILAVLVTATTGYWTQSGLKERDFLVANIKEREQLARDAAKRANSAIAGMLKANEERRKLARGEFDFLSDDQLKEIARGTNKLQQDWRLQREDIEMDLFLVFIPSSGVFDSWKNARQAVDQETDCVEKAVLQSQKLRAPPDVCQTFVQATTKAVTQLRERVRYGYDQLTKSK